MITIQGAHNTAVCYCSELEESAREQIKAICDRPEFAASTIRVMPDVHAGMGCTIGTTMTITDKVVPNMVGVDIGCGMETVQLAERELDFAALDRLIRRDIPCGREIRKTAHPLADTLDLTALRCAPHVNLARAVRSIGTLGGGNHFIEVDRAEDGTLYLVVHSGSRHLGNEVAKYYQSEGMHALCGNARHQLETTIAELKARGDERLIHETIKALKEQNIIPTALPKDLAYVQGTLFEDYLHDMKLVQQFAVRNRQAMTEVIRRGLGLTPVEEFTTIHNYIDTEEMLLRKGAVSAKSGQKLLIPINMRDGSLICVGKGNPDWNCSAPHGAGRLMSRRDAVKRLSMAEYKEQMAGIYSTCVVADTLDESPMAYKPMEEIVSQIAPTAEIIDCIHPVYNFKATE